MTTESKQEHRRGASPLLGSATAGLVVLAVVALAGALLAQQGGMTGALAGGSLALAVLVVSTAVVNAVAGLMPGASLLIALLTFVLQVLVLALVAVAIHDAGLPEQEFARGWFALGVTAVTLTWITVHTWLYTRLRIPAYDLPSHQRTGGEQR